MVRIGVLSLLLFVAYGVSAQEDPTAPLDWTKGKTTLSNVFIIMFRLCKVSCVKTIPIIAEPLLITQPSKKAIQSVGTKYPVSIVIMWF